MDSTTINAGTKSKDAENLSMSDAQDVLRLARAGELGAFVEGGVDGTPNVYKLQFAREVWDILQSREQEVAEAIRVAQEEACRAAEEARQAAKDAEEDGLTGLLRREYLDRELLRAIENILLHGGDKPFAFIFVDIDKFKEVNDTYGHSNGDEILRIVGKRFKRCLRKDDVGIRYGGEEMVFIVENLKNEEVAEAVAQKFVDVLNKKPIRISDGIELKASCSAGYSTFSPGFIDDTTQQDPKSLADALMNQADKMMYRAKRAGGNRVGGNDEEKSSQLDCAERRADQVASKETNLQELAHEVMDRRTKKLENEIASIVRQPGLTTAQKEALIREKMVG